MRVRSDRVLRDVSRRVSHSEMLEIQFSASPKVEGSLEGGLPHVLRMRPPRIQALRRWNFCSAMDLGQLLAEPSAVVPSLGRLTMPSLSAGQRFVVVVDSREQLQRR